MGNIGSSLGNEDAECFIEEDLGIEEEGVVEPREMMLIEGEAQESFIEMVQRDAPGTLESV